MVPLLPGYLRGVALNGASHPAGARRPTMGVVTGPANHLAERRVVALHLPARDALSIEQIDDLQKRKWLWKSNLRPNSHGERQENRETSSTSRDAPTRPLERRSRPSPSRP